MSKIDDGGPAFPCPEALEGQWFGMSLRDWLAGHAMQALIAMSNEDFNSTYSMTRTDLPCDVFTDIGEIAYLHADATIAARQKGGGE